MGVCTKERKGATAAVLMATPCTNSLGGESGGQKHEGCGGRSACLKYVAVSRVGLRRWFVLERPRRDTNGGSETEVTVTSKLPSKYCRFHLVCPGIKFGVRNFFWAWYKLKLICVLYFHFVPSPEKVPHAKFFPERGGGQTKWNRQYCI